MDASQNLGKDESYVERSFWSGKTAQFSLSVCELLQEDQEPFLLKNYISDRRCQLKRPSPKAQLQVKKRKPISQNSIFPTNFCKTACLFSFHDSPDPRKSPLFDFASPAKSPCKSPNAIFLHIPTRTAALLLEASLKIQKQSSSPKTKPQNKNSGFGLFGSILKRLTHRNRTRKREIIGDGVKVSVKDILRWDSSVGCKRFYEEESEQIKQEKRVSVEEEKSACGETGFSCLCNGRPSSAAWSESNEEKSLDLDLDLDTSCSSQSEEFEFSTKIIDSPDFGSCEKHFCESPFHFVLQRSPSPGRRTPDFSSPATSPSRCKTEDNENYDAESLKKLQAEEEEEEEKEQCSPVSVLDPPFEDDDDGHVDDSFDLECSYAIVQRAKQQLLHKLRRFEELAGLDPIELEKRMLEQDDDDDNNTYDQDEEEKCEIDESGSSDGEMSIDGFVQEVLKSNFHHVKRIPEDMKRLVSDLIAEQETEHKCCINREVAVKRVCNRLESWKEVESNTIDMMVDQDFKKELDGWKKNQEQVQETALHIEFSIFELLVKELTEQLVS